MVPLITTVRSSFDESNEYFYSSLQNIHWKNDKVVVFGKHIVTKRKTSWYGDSDYVYIYSNTEKKALLWTRELTKLKQVVENLSNTKFNSCLLNLYHDEKQALILLSSMHFNNFYLNGLTLLGK